MMNIHEILKTQAILATAIIIRYISKHYPKALHCLRKVRREMWDIYAEIHYFSDIQADEFVHWLFRKLESCDSAESFVSIFNSEIYKRKNSARSHQEIRSDRFFEQSLTNIWNSFRQDIAPVSEKLLATKFQ